MKGVTYKINHAAEVMARAFGKECTKSLDDFNSVDTDTVKENSEISEENAMDIIKCIFGDIESTKNVAIDSTIYRYLNITQVVSLRKMISHLRNGDDDRIETLYTLRDIGAYFSFLAIQLNRSVFGRKDALKVLTAAVALYDLCGKMMPYVFDDDITFEETHVGRPLLGLYS